MNSSIRPILLLLICPLISSALQPYRTFTDAQGRKIQASLISVRGDQVLVRTQDGQQHVLKASMLSPADQQYVAMHGGQSASGMPPGMPDALRRMMPGGPPPPSPPTTPSVPTTTPGASSSSDHGGMSLAADWIPQRTDTKRELIESLAFYAKAVVGNSAPGKETVPGNLIPSITWLMPIDQAVSKLPGRVNKIAERPIIFTCFPANSLTMISYQCNSFVDRNQTFNLLHFVVDAKRQVVGLEFVEQSPGKKTAPYEPQGKLEPYYNFLTLTNNSTTKREVVYQYPSIPAP